MISLITIFLNNSYKIISSSNSNKYGIKTNNKCSNNNIYNNNSYHNNNNKYKLMVNLNKIIHNRFKTNNKNYKDPNNKY